MLKVGQKVQVKVLGVDPERKRISLSMRELESDPWLAISQRFGEGQLVEGTITKLTKFGAFASLAGAEDYEVEGLIHISELSERRIEHPREVVNEGDKLRLRVIKVEPERRRIGLSLKRVDSPEYADSDWQAAMGEMAEVGSRHRRPLPPKRWRTLTPTWRRRCRPPASAEREEARPPQRSGRSTVTRRAASRPGHDPT